MIVDKYYGQPSLNGSLCHLWECICICLCRIMSLGPFLEPLWPISSGLLKSSITVFPFECFCRSSDPLQSPAWWCV